MYGNLGWWVIRRMSMVKGCHTGHMHLEGGVSNDIKGLQSILKSWENQCPPSPGGCCVQVASLVVGRIGITSALTLYCILTLEWAECPWRSSSPDRTLQNGGAAWTTESSEEDCQRELPGRHLNASRVDLGADSLAPKLRVKKKEGKGMLDTSREVPQCGELKTHNFSY